MPIEDPDWVVGELDRDELHERLEEQTLEEFLDEVRGRWGQHLDGSVQALGEDVLDSVNVRLQINYKPSLKTDPLIVGYRTLLYEAVNDTSMESELGKRRNNKEN